MQIRLANYNDYNKIREFYYSLIDAIENEEYKPGWKKDSYPSQEFLLKSIEKEEFYIGETDGQIVSCMAVNHDCNPEYRSVKWAVEAEDSEFLIIHALGVHPACSGRGIARQMIQKAIDTAREKNIKTIRLDVRDGNLPAERAYIKAGFVYRDTVRMFYEDTGWTNFKLFEYPLQEEKEE